MDPFDIYEQKIKEPDLLHYLRMITDKEYIEIIKELNQVLQDSVKKQHLIDL